ncbi:MRN complex-interacting protein isoform X1 [Thunnus maccoyii]|uniref:MRN complex-interacting protein isoform X1 n=1 Tax=Thunnus maccoyii TaxID=8240 RepID=UPI001C4BB0EA|nr:MRN complex-interacting protein isoform X1 [Thunnus maccoyii]
MSQQFHVLRCFTCQSFQVQQVKKVNRWSCKLCGEKQSLLKEFGRGSGAECRRHVQKLNAMRGAVMEEQEQNAWSLWKLTEEKPEEPRDDQVSRPQVSRWSKYLDAPEEEEPEAGPEENVLMDRQHFHGNNRKRKRTDSSFTPEQTGFCGRAVSLGADCQVKRGAGSSVSGWRDTTSNAPPPNKPRPQLPVSSIFESGDDFSFDL